ncbi:MAG TPA: BTAD domain-containing putative transcriptional regulator [Actinomycetes bacterium]|nr:BTAD domain-containing putative transcriptional regulator [Actinomycetes bacterium]
MGPQLRISILGPVEVEIDGRPLRLGSQQRALLAALALQAGRPVTCSRLIELLWGQPASAGAAATLRSHVRRLRHALETGQRRGIGATLLATEGAGAALGYTLRIAPEQVDATRFEWLAAEGRRALVAGDPQMAAERLRTALGLWRGPALGDVCERLSAVGAARRLEELRRAAQETWLEAELACGRRAEVLAELQGLAAEHPYDEELHGLLMRTLYRAGRRADALAAYRELYRCMVGELGMEPSAKLRQLEQAILTMDPALEAPPTAHDAGRPPGRDSGPQAQEPHRPGRWPAPAQLPPDLADFTGRAEQVTQIAALLAADREWRTGPPAVVVSAIAGKAGVGKTALAVHTAHRLRTHFPDGQLYANLHGAEERPADPAEVLGRFLRALGVEGASIPEELEERTGLYRSLLADRRVLVLLDNARDEHQVEALLPGLATCGVLVTSRSRLTGLAGVSALELDVLEPADAVELLGRVAGETRVAAEPEAARELVRLCGGLPLALRIAGARLAARPHWRLVRLVERLADERRRLDELAYRGLEVRASLALSYQGLDAAARTMLRRLGTLHAPDVAAWAGAALLDTSVSEAEELLERLVEVHLLDVAGQDPRGQVRYRFHDLVRVYARERAQAEEQAAERAAALARALGGWLGLAEQAHCNWCGGNYLLVHGGGTRWLPDADTVRRLVADPLAWLETERLAIAAAVQQAAQAGLDELCWDLAATAATLYRARCYYDDWRETHEQALAACRRAGNRRGQATLLLGLGEVDLSLDRYEQAAVRLEEALRRFAEVGDGHGRGLALYLTASVDRNHGNLAVALKRCEQAYAALRTAGDRGGEVHALRWIGLLHLELDRPEVAQEYLEQALATTPEAGRRLQPPVLHWLGEAHLRQGRFDQAAEAFLRALELMRRTGNFVGEPYVLCGLGVAYLREGRQQMAATTLSEAQQAARSVGDRNAEARVLHFLGECHLAQGCLDQAAACLGTALAHWREARTVLWQARTLHALGAVHQAVGDDEAAKAAWTEALALFTTAGSLEARQVVARLAQSRDD